MTEEARQLAVVAAAAPGVRTLAQARLERSGYRVAQAATVPELYARLSEGPCELVLLGPLDAPSVDVLTRLRSLPSTTATRVVVLHPTTLEEATALLAAGANDLVDGDGEDESIEKRLRITAVGSEHPALSADLSSRMRLADRLASIGQLAAGIGHELNNPLAYVLLNLQALDAALRETDDGTLRPHELHQWVSSALDGTSRMREIVDDLRTWARTDRDDVVYGVSVRRVVDAAARLTRAEIRRRAELVVDVDEELLVRARESELAQVLVNLLMNATQAIPLGSPSRHQIAVVATCTADEVEIRVSDSGCGIDPEHLPHLFQPFFTTKGREGTGLGLPVCYRIIQSFQGDMRIESERGAGTVVSVVIPRAAVPTKVAPRPDRPPSTAGGRVLLVEDDATLAQTFQRLMSAHDVVVAGSGEEAVSLLEQSAAFDVVLCDLMMPGMTGMDVHRWVSRHRPALVGRMVFMTGGAYTREMRAFVEGGAVSVLHKPFTLSQLEAALSAVLDAEPGRPPHE